VAQGVIDDLEAIQIEHRHGEWTLPRDRLFQAIGKQQPIGESGEASCVA
jgi:hypothetical protein